MSEKCKAYDFESLVSVITYKDGFAVMVGGAMDWYYNIMDDGFSSKLHKNCYVATRDGAEKIRRYVIERLCADPNFIDRTMD